MVSSVFQMHVFRPTQDLATRERIATQTSFARQLAAASDRSAASDPSTRGPADAARGAAPWLRSADKRALAGSIERASEAIGVEPDVAVAVAIAESSLDPTARAADGLSAGTFQVRPSTASDMRALLRSGEVARAPGGDDVVLGVTYLRHLDDLFAESTELRPGLRTVAVPDPAQRQHFAVAAFNAGQGRVAAAQAAASRRGADPRDFASVRPHLPSITRTYVDRVSRYSDRPRPGTA